MSRRSADTGPRGAAVRVAHPSHSRPPALGSSIAPQFACPAEDSRRRPTARSIPNQDSEGEPEVRGLATMPLTRKGDRRQCSG